MTMVDPARFANYEQAMHPHFPEHYGPTPERPKRRIRSLVKRVVGKRDQRS